MAYRQYTKCFQYSPGDKPFHESDLVGTILLVGGVSLLGAILSYAFGFFVVGAVFMAVGYAGTIADVAKKWLNHRLVCIGDQPKCAVGVVESTPEVSGFGEFDNDEFFDLRLMTHRPGDDYKSDNTAYKTGGPGPSQDGKTELKKENDVYLDGFQGESLMKPIFDLSYKLDRTKLHVEAEGNFWQAMLDFALLLGILVGVASGLGALAGAAIGCAIGALFAGIGCIIGAIIGAIIGGLAGGAAGAYIGAQIAFHSDPGDVEDANVGDKSLGPISENDKVVVYGRHVYDGFHEGWHEIHPLMKVVKLHPEREASAYIEWDPLFNDPAKIPTDLPDMPANITLLSISDMTDGLASQKFRDRAVWLRDKWCGLLDEAAAETTGALQATELHRWTIHPDVDGCEPEEIEPPK